MGTYVRRKKPSVSSRIALTLNRWQRVLSKVRLGVQCLAQGHLVRRSPDQTSNFRVLNDSSTP